MENCIYTRLWKLYIRETSNEASGFLRSHRIHMALPGISSVRVAMQSRWPGVCHHHCTVTQGSLSTCKWILSCDLFPHTLMLRTSDVSFCCCCWQIFHYANVLQFVHPLNWWQRQISDWSQLGMILNLIKQRVPRHTLAPHSQGMA